MPFTYMLQCADASYYVGSTILLDERVQQHRLAQIDADDAVVARVIRQRDAGADADFENASARAAGLFGGGDCRGARGDDRGAC